MAAAADLTLLDKLGNAVTYTPFSVEQDAVEFNESGALTIQGTRRARLGRKIPADRSNGVYRTVGKLTYPIINATTGALDGTFTGNFEILRPAKLLTADVNEFHARFESFVAQEIVRLAVVSGAIPT